ncbi:hypothetical protein XELAEV_18020776mg [Xenopus laevis]|uniref:LRRCT domain-containing protein n=1 Tax=Xenopus laevis TaxID=8355 RepID=A0A974D8D9_XENLA|nr:hypothetical protein XELAEV_18020776mg [Xenopus laevis]
MSEETMIKGSEGFQMRDWLVMMIFFGFFPASGEEGEEKELVCNFYSCARDKRLLRNLILLMNLDVNHNLLLDFPWSDLSTLHKLQILILNNNRLVYLPLDTFSSTKELRSLQLSNNHFSTKAEGTFQPLSSLSHIQLHSNPFNCSCQLMWLKDWLEKTNLPNKLTIDRRKEIAFSSPKEFGVSLV